MEKLRPHMLFPCRIRMCSLTLSVISSISSSSCTCLRARLATRLSPSMDGSDGLSWIQVSVRVWQQDQGQIRRQGSATATCHFKPCIPAIVRLLVCPRPPMAHADSHLQVLLAPAGVVACFRPLTDASLFLLLYGLTAVYFSGVMVSL